MINKVLLDVALPGPAAPIVRGFQWIILFVILAFIIAIVSTIIIVRGVKKTKLEEERKAAEEQYKAEGASEE